MQARHRRRRRIPLAAIVGALAVTAGALALALKPGPARPAPNVARVAGPAPKLTPRSKPSPDGGPEVPGNAVAFARAEGVELYLPAPDPILVAYHEASYHTAAAMTPLGTLRRNANRTKFEAPERTPGPDFIVMSSRGRPTPATSAADVVLPRRTRLHSPVTGRVVKAKRYRLYGAYRDWRVEIAVAGHPGVRVVLIHLDGVRVRRGDGVSATLSVIGRPRVLPFGSQVDDYENGGDPHVHIEIKKPPQKAASPN